MSNHFLYSIEKLPLELTDDDAVASVYREDLDWIESKLRQGLSVLVECDKQLTLFLYKAIRQRFRRSEGEQRLLCRLISGHSRPQEDGEGGGMGMMMQTRMQRILTELQEAVYSGAPSQVVVLPYLDVLTTTTRSGLGMEARETAALLYENPDVVFLGFKDPSFEIPKVIEEAFTVRHSMIGISRDKIPALITQREARKFGIKEFSPYSLYKFFSGLNVVRCRQILSHFKDRMDFNPKTAETSEEIFKEIRQMTLVSDLEIPKVDLDKDIGGYAKVKEEIREEILDLLMMKEKATSIEEIKRIEEIIPKGIIFHGPPGTGKTFFAKAIATVLDATVHIVSGPELKSRWVGESEENLRRVFSQARKSAPSIIVFDELDSFASARGMYSGSGVEHSMVNQLLTEMDGFRKEEMVLIMGTTNFVESLDPALMRPGRFELSIQIPYPEVEDRLAILQVYRKKFEIQISDEMLDLLVQKTGGYVNDVSHTRFSGDHLNAIMRSLKREELRRGKGPMEITSEDLDKAIKTRKKKKVTLEKDEENTVAIHEAGHAICAYVLPNCSAIEEVSIATDDNDTLGYVMREVKENKYITTRSELLDDICVLFGGRIAEQMMLGEISIGSYNDLQRASEIARMMVEELGMGESVGLRTYNINQQDMVELGTPRRPLSETLAARIDNEIEKIMVVQKEKAEKILLKHKKELQKIVDSLLEKKVIHLKELKEIFGVAPSSEKKSKRKKQKE